MKRLFFISAFMLATASMISCTADDAAVTDAGNIFKTQADGGDEGGIPIPPPPPPKPPVK